MDLGHRLPIIVDSICLTLFVHDDLRGVNEVLAITSYDDNDTYVKHIMESASFLNC